MILDKRYFERKMMKSKEVEDVLGGADSWKNVDKTEVNCREEKCDNREAYFRQVQIRSADEPMTTFYKVCLMLWSRVSYWLTSRQCTRCASEWREN
jgi:DNA-directed RNA polymerase III subunit RPC11